MSCITCKYADTNLADKEYKSVLEMVKDSENDFLICTNKKNHKKIFSTKFAKWNKMPLVPDNFICKYYKEIKC